MTTAELKRFIARIPKEPGIYIFKSVSGAPLYIGKAGNLKNRVSAYLKTTDTRLGTMVRSAKTVTFTRTDSDVEALLAESQLIKRHRPRFNIMLRDDKQYFYVGFSQEDFPKIFLTHQPVQATSNMRQETRRTKNLSHGRLSHVSSYIGPFTDGTALKTALKLLRTIFPYCTCTQEHHLLCLNAHIGMCLGVCCLRQPTISNAKFLISKRQYRKNIQSIRMLLSGKRVSFIRKLEKEMILLGKEHKFEEAIALRGRVEKMRRVFENAKIIRNWKLEIGNSALVELQHILKLKHVPVRIEGYDISNIQGISATGSMAVFTDGRADKNEYRKFRIRTVTGSDDTAMLKEVLTRRLRRSEWPYPDLILVDGGKGQLNAAIAASNKLPASPKLQRGEQATSSKLIPIIALTKEKHRGIRLVYKKDSMFHELPLSQLPEAVRNLVLRIDGEAHRFAVRYHRRLHGRALVTS